MARQMLIKKYEEEIKNKEQIDEEKK